MLITAENIHKSYGQVEVLKGVDISVAESEILTIVGASGAGKSTLLHIIGTLDKADQGKVIFQGKNLSELKSKELAKFRNRHIGFVFQFHHLLPEFTAIENVMIPGMIAKTAKSQLKKDALELLNYLGLSSRLDHKPSALSGGEQQRVAVARALINRPKIVLADEPSGNLDSKSADELHQLFFDLKKEFNQSFVIATHNKKLAEMADRKYEMIDGLIKSN